jgi:hypothetical protein
MTLDEPRCVRGPSFGTHTHAYTARVIASALTCTQANKLCLLVSVSRPAPCVRLASPSLRSTLDGDLRIPLLRVRRSRRRRQHPAGRQRVVPRVEPGDVLEAGGAWVLPQRSRLRVCAVQLDEGGGLSHGEQRRHLTDSARHARECLGAVAVTCVHTRMHALTYTRSHVRAQLCRHVLSHPPTHTFSVTRSLFIHSVTLSPAHAPIVVAAMLRCRACRFSPCVTAASLSLTRAAASRC